MKKQSPALNTTVFKYLLIIEKILLAGLIIALFMTTFKMNAIIIFKICLGGLAPVYFLSAYKPSIISSNQNQREGFIELLGNIILSKIVWISFSISTFGILFYLLGNVGYKQMLLIGSSSIAISLFMLIILFIIGLKNSKGLMPALYRAVPLLLVTAYILIRK